MLDVIVLIKGNLSLRHLTCGQDVLHLRTHGMPFFWQNHRIRLHDRVQLPTLCTGSESGCNTPQPHAWPHDAQSLYRARLSVCSAFRTITSGRWPLLPRTSKYFSDSAEQPKWPLIEQVLQSAPQSGVCFAMTLISTSLSSGLLRMV